MRFLVTPDSFKGTFSATEVAAAIGEGVLEAGGEADLCPLADGGEGTLDALLTALGGRRVAAGAHDPLGRPLRAELGLLGTGETALVEVAAASGLPLLAAGERDAERADTYGTGELIGAAAASGARTILVAAGGSASTDGGRGAIEAIEAAGGIGAARLQVLCDVEAPFEDAARVFAPQKGADAATVERLSARLQEFAETLPRDPRGVPMGGCAGGLSGGLMAAFGARLLPGAEYVLDAVGFDARLAVADRAVSGEGQVDAQSLRGKVVGAVAERCAGAGKRLDVLVGRDALDRARTRAAGIASVTEAGTLERLRAAAASLAAQARPTA
jgi:glycerate kinase